MANPDKNERIELEEVRDVLSYQIWKTRARVLREISEKRIRESKSPVALDWPMRIRVRRLLFKLLRHQQVEIKTGMELTNNERHWANDQDLPSLEELQAAAEEKRFGHREQLVYRLLRETGKRVKDEFPYAVGEKVIA